MAVDAGDQLWKELNDAYASSRRKQLIDEIYDWSQVRLTEWTDSYFIELIKKQNNEGKNKCFITGMNKLEDDIRYSVNASQIATSIVTAHFAKFLKSGKFRLEIEDIDEEINFYIVWDQISE